MRLQFHEQRRRRRDEVAFGDTHDQLPQAFSIELGQWCRVYALARQPVAATIPWRLTSLSLHGIPPDTREISCPPPS
jgi:hypothetical protein